MIDNSYSENIDLIISKFGKDYVSSTKNHISYNCPFCESRRGKSDDDHKLYVNYVKLVFFCFKCHASGRLKVKNIDSSYGVYDKLAKYKNMNLDIFDEDEEDNMFYIPNIEITEKSSAMKYCLKRGISKDLIKYYNIRLGISELFGRIVIPNEVYGLNGIWTDMYSSRSYLDYEPKYKNPSGSNKNDVVFNLHNIEEGSDIYINEGVITSIIAGKNSVALYGCAPSREQISKILSKKPSNIYCTLDGDEAGRPANEKLAKTLSESLSKSNVYLVNMPYNKDAADLGEIKYKRYVENNKILYYSDVYKNLVSYIKKKS